MSSVPPQKFLFSLSFPCKTWRAKPSFSWWGQSPSMYQLPFWGDLHGKQTHWWFLLCDPCFSHNLCYFCVVNWLKTNRQTNSLRKANGPPKHWFGDRGGHDSALQDFLPVSSKERCFQDSHRYSDTISENIFPCNSTWPFVVTRRTPLACWWLLFPLFYSAFHMDTLYPNVCDAH